jgi:3-oxoacyl-[acyl-carrier-protein] synthase II
MGPNHAVVTACSTGAHAIGDAARLIKRWRCRRDGRGRRRSPICPIGIAGFAQARALSTKLQR